MFSSKLSKIIATVSHLVISLAVSLINPSIEIRKRGNCGKKCGESVWEAQLPVNKIISVLNSEGRNYRF